MRRALGPSPFPRQRRRTKTDTRHSSEVISTLDTVLPLHVIASNQDGEAQEEVETDLDAVSSAPTPFVSRERVRSPPGPGRHQRTEGIRQYGTDHRSLWEPNDLRSLHPVSKRISEWRENAAP